MRIRFAHRLLVSSLLPLAITGCDPEAVSDPGDQLQSRAGNPAAGPGNACPGGPNSGKARRLFIEAPDNPALLDPAQQAQLEAQWTDPMTVELNVVRARPRLVTGGGGCTPAEQLALNLFPGEALVFARDELIRRATDDVTWSGRDPAAPGSFDSANIVGQGDRLFGSIHADGQYFRVLPLGDDLHVVARLDPSLAPEPSLDDTGFIGPGTLPDPVPDDEEPLPPECRIVTLLLAVTPAARTWADAFGGEDGLLGMIHAGLADANDVLQNSGLDVRFEVVFYYETEESLTGNNDDDGEALMDPNDNAFDEIHEHRAFSGADVVVMVVNPYNQGYAVAMPADASSAFVFVPVGSLGLPKNSLTHEIAHLFGAQHDPKNANPEVIFEHGYGYIHPTENWCTNMSYSCERLPVFSTPLGTYGGDPIGDDEQSNVRRVIHERACIVSAFEDTKTK